MPSAAQIQAFLSTGGAPGGAAGSPPSLLRGGSVGAVKGVGRGGGLSLGPYDDAGALLERFDAKALLRSIEGAVPPAPFSPRDGAKWRSLVARLLASPNFRPWFSARRQQALDSMSALQRMQRLATPPAAVCADPATGAPLPQSALFRLFHRIQSELASAEAQAAAGAGDGEQLACMRAHKDAVAAALTPAPVIAGV
jgi:hypothetical protein